jgi:ABC-type taurine transport system ATPase subunit
LKSNQSNPFSTRFVAPGEIAWIENSCNPKQLYEGWMQHNRRGAIVGPHGCGKSTLLQFAVPLIGPVTYRRDATGQLLHEESGSSLPEKSLVWLQLRKACPSSMPIPWELLTSNSTLIVDGYEQLNYIARLLLLFKTQQRNVGLLITAHRKTWLPTLCRLSVTAGLAREIAVRLVSQNPSFKLPTEPEMANALRRNRGNLREVLMELYDEFEARGR